MAAFGQIPRGKAGACLEDSAAVKAGKPELRVRCITGNTAIVALVQDCIRQTPPCPPGLNCQGGAVRFETDYLVVRTNGHWELKRAIAGGETIGL
ncbi:MAG: hypothetical protein ACJ8AK_17285 [Gemmatimonadaceae bacterium]